MRAYIGITGHFTEDFKLQSVMLACHRFKGSHTADNILAAYQQVLATYNVEDKVAAVITDNAANMLKAFITLPGMYRDAVDNLDIEDEDDDEYEMITSFDFDVVGEHISCFLHTLQLVVKEGLQNIGAVSSTIAKASKMVSYVRKSSLASDLLDGGPKLQAKNDTRWNSTNKMLKSILHADTEKLDQLDCPTKLTKYELTLIREVTDILSPFESATTQCEGQNIVTSSLVIPCVRGLRAEMEELSSTYKSKMVATLRSSIDRRLTKFEQTENFQIAAPRRSPLEIGMVHTRGGHSSDVTS